jgi:hypothetical protein
MIRTADAALALIVFEKFTNIIVADTNRPKEGQMLWADYFDFFNILCEQSEIRSVPIVIHKWVCFVNCIKVLGTRY